MENYFVYALPGALALFFTAAAYFVHGEDDWDAAEIAQEFTLFLILSYALFAACACLPTMQMTKSAPPADAITAGPPSFSPF